MYQAAVGKSENNWAEFDAPSVNSPALLAAHLIAQLQTARSGNELNEVLAALGSERSSRGAIYSLIGNIENAGCAEEVRMASKAALQSIFAKSDTGTDLKAAIENALPQGVTTVSYRAEAGEKLAQSSVTAEAN